ncbi:MAG: hypothetical protein M1830_005309 [Pleopsidium flavum]|nr:MAG: hypothetical protein M1830_005309 [Pleopsidium flavum]
MTASFTLRCPTVYMPSPTLPPSTVRVPLPEQLLGQWYITHTSSPAWQDKRNVVLTYTVLASSINQPYSPMDDLITYQSQSSSKLQTVHGTDTPSRANPCAWTWRGNGWLKFVTSHWEILGHGELEASGQWIVVYAQKSIFTPAVINVYTRKKEGLPEAMRKRIEGALEELGHEDLRALSQPTQDAVTPKALKGTTIPMSRPSTKAETLTLAAELGVAVGAAVLIVDAAVVESVVDEA